ncbi:OmpH family outer membrane protein [Marinospirillum alkaliphilum]|uniref:Periplasmic chaperone for outer membrane proteins Skp n=1 Tax=Marinospirillum alkaliphilum DSM 21637 TaxID=1122209 RepID=A0A1K1W3M8_9GAMM|nr:OmpH family outer membrane protein [Marinospirillum alkaliphilum]SFX31524.1 periplasmic chaperone for outer membrane proteins Skp [Marinospirillum alkaliphilum DSM 21637]
MKRMPISMLALLALLVLPGLALAEQPQRIAVLDWQAALMESEKVRNDMQQAERQLSNEQARVRQLAEEGRGLQERMQRDGSIMSETERRQLQQQMEQKLQEYQLTRNRLQQQQQELRQEIINRHRPALERAVNELLQQHNIDILLDRGAVAFAKPQYDLTPAVAEKLNAQE